MITSIIGTGNIGSAVAAHLVTGNQRVLVASAKLDDAEKLADSIGDGATAVTVDEAITRGDVIIFAVWIDVTRQLVDKYASQLRGKIVVDPSNPIAPDGNGGFTKTLPAEQSSGQLLSTLLPPGARLVKAFGSMSADSLRDTSRREPNRVVAFYATDDVQAGTVVARLIEAAGFDPIRVGGIDSSIRIEVFGDLHEFGGLGTTVARDQALKAL